MTSGGLTQRIPSLIIVWSREEDKRGFKDSSLIRHIIIDNLHFLILYPNKVGDSTQLSRWLVIRQVISFINNLWRRDVKDRILIYCSFMLLTDCGLTDTLINCYCISRWRYVVLVVSHLLLQWIIESGRILSLYSFIWVRVLISEWISEIRKIKLLL